MFPRMLISIIAALMVLFPVAASAQWQQLGFGIFGDWIGDRAGCSVSLSADGSRVAVGAYLNDASATDGGMVRVFEFINGSWVQLGGDITGAETNGWAGFSVALSADGLRLAVGAPGTDVGGADAGIVRVYEWLDPTWAEIGAIVGGHEDDLFGYSVALSANGSRLAAGGPHAYTGGFYKGHARVYRWINPNWFQVGGDLEGESTFDEAGHSVSLSADGLRVAIGAPANSQTGVDAGHVRVYEWFNLTSTWLFVGDHIYGEAAGDRSGTSVSLSGDGARLAVGAPENDDAGSLSGHVRIFEYDGSAWDHLGQDLDGEAAGDESGSSVSLSADGSRVAIGSPHNDGVGNSAGHVRVFEWQAPSWVQAGNDIDGDSEDDRFGASCSLSEDGLVVAVGAPDANGFSYVKGEASVFGEWLFADGFESGNTWAWTATTP